MKLQGKSYAAWFDAAGPYEVLSLGIRMERGAAKTYRAMAKNAPSAALRAKFRYLAEEEREHGRLLAEARVRTRPSSKARPLPVSASEAETVVEGRTPAEAVRLALRSEHEAEIFYRECASRCRRAKGRKLFETLAAQESGHAAALEREFKALRGPLPWSSLEGFVPEEKDYWTA